MRDSFLSSIARVICENSFQHVVRFVSGIFPLASFHRSVEIKPHRMNGFGGEDQLVAIQLAAAEVLIEKRSLVAFPVSIPRNKSRYPPPVLHRYLDELSVLQETVHPGKLSARLCVLRRRRRLFRFRSR